MVRKGIVKDYDYAMVRECQARVSHIANKAAQARRVGVEPSTWHRWLGGTIPTPLRGPRDALEHFLGIDQMTPEAAARFREELVARWPRPATSSASNGEGKTDRRKEERPRASRRRPKGRPRKPTPGRRDTG